MIRISMILTRAMSIHSMITWEIGVKTSTETFRSGRLTLENRLTMVQVVGSSKAGDGSTYSAG